MSENDVQACPNGLSVKMQYASSITYALSIIGAVFTFIFLTVLTRRLTVNEYGTWTMITNYVSYFLIPSMIFSTWVTRGISRGQNYAKTGFVSSMIFGLVSVPLYALLMQYISASWGQPVIPLEFSAFILFFEYLNTSMTSISCGYAPQKVGYISITNKIGQAVFGYVILTFFGLGLFGAVIAAIIGRLLMNIVALWLNRSIIVTSRFNRAQMFSWFKISWLPLYSSITSIIASFDVVIVRIIYGNEIPIGYYGLATSIIAMILFAGVVTNSLYPKILAKHNLDDLREGIWLSLLFSIPLIGLTLIYAEPLSAIFGVKYLAAAWGLRIFAVGAIAQLLTGLATTAYLGLEGIDQGAKMSSRALLKSAFFKNYTIIFLANVFYLAMLSIAASMNYAPAYFLSLWGVVNAVAALCSFFAQSHFMKRNFGQSFPFRALGRDLLVFSIPAIPAIVPFLIIQIPISEVFSQMFINLLVPSLPSLAIYLGVLYAIDPRFRLLARKVLRFVSRKNST